MEKPEVCVGEYDIVLVRGLNALSVHYTATGCSEILDPTPERTMNIVGEWEERVARARDAAQLLCVRRLLFLGEGLRNAVEQTLPLLLLSAFEYLSTNEEVDPVCLLGTLDALLERKSKYSRMVAEPPEVRFVSCEARAVDTRLLAGTDTDDSTTIGVGNTVGLSVLQGKSGDDKISERLVRKLSEGQRVLVEYFIIRTMQMTSLPCSS